VGAMHTDQGLLEGAAHDTLRRRRWLGVGPEDAGAAVVAGAAGVAGAPGAARAPGVLIAADVHVKHAIPPAGATLEDTARDLVGRGLADLLVVSGRGTGLPTDPDRLRQVREAAPHTPIWVGSGVTPETVAGLFQLADGAIVGSALQEEGRAGRPVEAARVRALVTAARG
jgi:predicted TIM-barrel enzyme